jgi:hypothetical protein
MVKRFVLFSPWSSDLCYLVQYTSIVGLNESDDVWFVFDQDGLYLIKTLEFDFYKSVGSLTADMSLCYLVHGQVICVI